MGAVISLKKLLLQEMHQEWGVLAGRRGEYKKQEWGVQKEKKEL